ncbi:MAG: glutaredoxin [bacterium]|nr:glutaredoxin [bacterium]
MPQVEIYTKPWCGYCFRAKKIFDEMGVEYEEIDLRSEPAREAEMIRRSRRLTVPQIFVDGRHLGDSMELRALAESGELRGILQAAAKENDGGRA